MSGAGPAVPAHAPLRVAAYRRMWLAAVVSHIGTFLQLTAGPWLMHELTGSPLLVSLVTTALLLPRLLLTLPSGALADLVDRRTLLLVGYVVSAVPVTIMAVLASMQALTPVLLLVLTTLVGVGNAITLPSFQTFVPDLVPRPLLAQAVTLNSAAFNVARAVGPSIGGALVAVGLTHVAFGANAVSYLGVIGVVLTFPRQPAEEDPRRRRLWRSTALGVRYVRFTRPIRILLVMSGMFALSAASIQALLPSLSSDDLGLGAAGFGLLFAMFGSGALIGAATRDRLRVTVGRRMLPGTVLVFGLAGIVVGLAGVPVVVGAALLVAGATWVWTTTTINASVQTLAPGWVRGRVVSLYLVTVGLQPVGALVGGVLAELTSPGVAVATMTGASVAVGIVGFRLRLPVLGETPEPQPVPEDWVVPEHATQVTGTPIVVTTEFEIDVSRASEFLDAMRALRRQRLRTGAVRWSLFRDAERPGRLTEMFVVPDWQEHLAQHARIDAEAAAIIQRARDFDVRGEPHARHLAGVDLSTRAMPDLLDAAVDAHAALHRTDGSVPLGDDVTPVGDQRSVAGTAADGVEGPEPRPLDRDQR